MRKFATLAAVMALASAQVAVAAPAPVKSAAAKVQRAGTPAQNKSELGAFGAAGFIISAAAIAAIIAGIIAAAKANQGNNGQPTSPG